MGRLIDADKAVNVIAELIEQEWGYEGIKEDVKGIFEKAPTVDAEPVKHGKWGEPFRNIYGEKVYTCPECSYLVLKKENYCPNCGAKMDGEQYVK